MRGIYSITNVVTNTIYYGQSIDINRRLTDHAYLLRKNEERNKHLQHSWNKYGKEAFEFKPIEVVEDTTIRLSPIEKKYIDGAPELGLKIFNVANPIDCSDISLEVRKKISESKIGKPRPDMIGNKYTLGHKLSEEHRKKVSIALTGNKHPGFGKHPSEETRFKMSVARKQFLANKNRLK
jgi:group I intron endonuclease